MPQVARKILLSVAGLATILPLTGCAGQLLPSAFDQTAPAVNGENVVWEDQRDADSKGYGTDVYSYNIGTLIESPVAVGLGDQDQPAISDQYIVWNDDGRLMARTLPVSDSSPAFPVVNGPATQTDPAVCGSLVVWSDTRNNSDVYAKQLPNGPEYQVATSSAVEAYPACDAGRVVYMYSPIGSDADIRLYDISSGQTQVVANQLWNEWRPAISGNRVVWQAWPSQPDTTQGIDIFGKNLDTGQGFVVSNGLGNQTAPVISGSTVAWEDDRLGRSVIWWRDLATTMNEMPADSNVSASQQAPSLFQRRLVFQGNAPGPWNVYIGNLFFFTGGTP